MATERTSSSKHLSEHANTPADETQLLYMQIKMNLESIRCLANEVNDNMKNIKRNMTITKKLLEAVKPSTEQETMQ